MLAPSPSRQPHVPGRRRSHPLSTGVQFTSWASTGGSKRAGLAAQARVATPPTALTESFLAAGRPNLPTRPVEPRAELANTIVDYPVILHNADADTRPLACWA